MKLRLYFSLSLLLLFFTIFTSISYAYTFDEFIYFVDSIKNDATQFNRSTSAILNYQNALKTKIGNKTYKTYVVKANNDGGYTTVYATNNNITISSFSNNTISFNQRYSFDEYNISYSNGSIDVFTGINLRSLPINNYYGLIVSSNDWTNFGNGYFNNKYVEPYTGPVFTPSNNGSIQVIASNGISENMTRLPFTYTGQNDWTLGYLSDFHDVYSIFGYFGPLFYRDGQLYTESYQNEFSYNKYYGTKNSGLIFDSSTGRIAIKKEKLVNKQGYSLLLEYRLNNGDSLEDIGEYNYYAYFYNLSISSGDLVSPDINSTVDIGMLNALDEYFDYSSGDFTNVNYNLNEILNFSGDLFSGDYLSGEIFNKIGYKNYHTSNEYSLTLYDFYRRIIGVLLDDSPSSYIEFEYRGNNYRFYASDFKTPDSAFKTFISGFIIVLFSIGIVKRLAVLFKRMAILDFVGISSSFDVDDSNFL